MAQHLSSVCYYAYCELKFGIKYDLLITYTRRFETGADLGFLKRQSKSLDSDRCDVIVMTSPTR